MDGIQYFSLTECAIIKGINNSEMQHRIIQSGLGRRMPNSRGYLLTKAELDSIDITLPLTFDNEHRPYFDAINKNDSTSSDFILVTESEKIKKMAQRLGYIE